MCPKCKCEMRIGASRVKATGDDRPDEQTQVFNELDMVCRNPACSNYEQVVETVYNKIL